MPRLKEHLASPQFPDEDPEKAAEDATKPGWSLVKITGGWVAPGQPRWRAYLLYGLSLGTGIFLALTSTGGFDLLAFGGVAFAAFGVFGLAETVRGTRFPRP